jgi:enoyl-[acyl-carrier protein] reductase I
MVAGSRNQILNNRNQLRPNTKLPQTGGFLVSASRTADGGRPNRLRQQSRPAGRFAAPPIREGSDIRGRGKARQSLAASGKEDFPSALGMCDAPAHFKRGRFQTGTFAIWTLAGAILDFRNMGDDVPLTDKKGLIVGIANANSIAYGCAKAMRQAGATLAVTYLNDKAEPYVRPLAEALDSPIIVPCDVRAAGQLEAVFDRIRDEWGGLDFLLHSIAFAPKDDLHSRMVDCSREGFAMAMDVSCHSFIRMARLAEPLMESGGCLLTITFYGSEKVVSEYNLMGPVKSALESSVRYMAAELGQKRIRVHALSPGPLKTRAASGIDRFDELLDRARAQTPEHRLVSIEDVGSVATFLVGDSAAALTGNIEYIDAGYHIMG